MNHRSTVAASHLALSFAAFLAVSGAAASQGPPPPPPPPPPQLGPVPVPPQNPVTEPKRVLGKILFWDEQLSSDNTVACGTCHRPELGGSEARTAFNPGLNGTLGNPDDVAGSPGVIRATNLGDYTPDATFGLFAQVTRRRSPDFTGGLFSPQLFWDGRAGPAFINPDTATVVIPLGGALEAQALAPILSDGEMAHTGRTFAQATSKLQSATPLRLASNVPADMAAAISANPTYPLLFQAAFGTPAITAQRIAFSIATYERTLVPNQTAYDAFAAGNPTALTPSQVQGLNLFVGPVGRCDTCHTPPVFTNNTFRNIGLRPIAEDNGRQGITGNINDRGRFKVPSLRNAALRPRFFHNGMTTTLTDAVEFYNGSGGNFNDNEDPVLQGLNFTPAQRDLIVDFLQALVDPRAAAGTFPFDRPTLYSETASPGSVLYGAPTAGPLGFTPEYIGVTPPSINNPFKVGLRLALGSAPAYFGISSAAAMPGLPLANALLHLDPYGLLLAVPFQTQGAGPGGGFATFRVDIPNAPGVIGAEFFGQWMITDILTGAVSATTGAHHVVF